MTDTDPTLRGLLASVLATPEDDVPRLVLADWLEENGEPERAEFIRIQCELARLSVSPCGGYYCDEAIGHIDCEDPTGEKRAAASKRSRELLEQPSHGTHGAANWCVWSKPASDLIPSNSGSLFGQPFEFRRGFVESVTCDLATFMGGVCGRCDETGVIDNPDGGHDDLRVCPDCHGKRRTPGIAPRLFALQPVLRVTLTDAVIHPSGGNYTYYVGGLGRFPREYWSSLENLPSRRAALDALSAACVAYGRANAEGMTHEAVCERCDVGPGMRRYPTHDGNWIEDECNECSGTGKVRKPGLPPLTTTSQDQSPHPR